MLPPTPQSCRERLNSRGRPRGFGVMLVMVATVTGVAGCTSTTRAPSTSQVKDSSGTSPVKGSSDTHALITSGDAGAVVAPSCAKPATPLSNLPLATPAPAGTAGQALKAGTDHSVDASAWTYPAAQVRRWIQHPTVDQPATKIAFITFDDGPTSNITPLELDNLAKAGVHATFFQIGHQVGSVDPALEERIIAEGNAIGVHSYSHDYTFLYPHGVADATRISCDYQWGRYAIARSLGAGYDGDVSRYPGGHMSWKDMAPADQALATLGDTWIDWNAMSGDAEPYNLRPHSVAAMIRSVDHQAATNKGHVLVILDHDAADKHLTAAAMPGIINDLKARGYTFGIIG